MLAVRETTLELETQDVDHLLITDVKNTISWRTRKRDLQHTFLWTF
jgi:hypothetical protein